MDEPQPGDAEHAAFVAGFNAALDYLAAKPSDDMPLHDWGGLVFAQRDGLAETAWGRFAAR